MKSRKGMKKCIAGVLALVISLGTVTACGNSGSNSSGDKELMDVTFPLEEQMTFTGMAIMKDSYALTDNLAWQIALERANIQIDLTNILSSELTEKRNLLLNSAQYPEVLFKTNVPANTYGMEGILIPLEDLIRDYAPNLTALLDETDGWQYITAQDGHVYSLPMQSEEYAISHPLWINKRWMDNLGLNEPTSYDELYNVLKAFKEQDANGNGDANDEIPYSACGSSNMLRLMQYQNYSYDEETHLAVIDGKLTHACTHDSFKELLTFVRKLYKEELLDKNSFTQNQTQLYAKGQSGDILGSFADGGCFRVVGKESDEDYIMLTPFQEGTYPIDEPWLDGALAITDKCQNPEVIVAWADYFYSEEGARLTWMGVEGETYQINEDGSWDWLLGNGYGDDVTSVRACGAIQGTAPQPSALPEIWYELSAESDPEEVYLNQQRKKLHDMGAIPIPVLDYTEEEREILADIKVDVDAYIMQYFAQVVTGQISLDDTWDSYLKTLKEMGIDEMMDIYAKAYENVAK